MFINIEKSKDKTKNYKILLDNVDFYLVNEDSLVTNLANLSAYLNYFLTDINWVGFYLLKGNLLRLGPFQGLPACTRIKLGEGVCGKSASERTTIIVDDVHKFSSHISCDSESNSEIVIPIVKKDKLIGVLDIDSTTYSRFDNTDKLYLEKLINKLIDIL